MHGKISGADEDDWALRSAIDGALETGEWAQLVTVRKQLANPPKQPQQVAALKDHRDQLMRGLKGFADRIGFSLSEFESFVAAEDARRRRKAWALSQPAERVENERDRLWKAIEADRVRSEYHGRMKREADARIVANGRRANALAAKPLVR
jgi:hypothetical protein